MSNVDVLYACVTNAIVRAEHLDPEDPNYCEAWLLVAFVEDRIVQETQGRGVVTQEEIAVAQAGAIRAAKMAGNSALAEMFERSYVGVKRDCDPITQRAEHYCDPIAELSNQFTQRAENYVEARFCHEAQVLWCRFADPGRLTDRNPCTVISEPEQSALTRA